MRYREFVLSPYGVIKIKSLGYMFINEVNLHQMFCDIDANRGIFHVVDPPVIRELYASRVGHNDAGSLRGSTPYLPNPSLLSNVWDAFISFSLRLPAAQYQAVY
ncbi:hypothetical protein [Symbiopectobacterium purcellii]|uniref:hypothetical protein n=1 Tax=Symbiopectobacterium purcellii TaxID=2871826 RepID=UPI003F82C889